MNELEPYEDEDCGRCRAPLGPRRFSLRLDADPPLAAPIELWICDRCMESMSRWMQRRQGAPRAADREPDDPAPRKGRPRRPDRRSHYAEVLDRNEAWIHRKSWLVVWLALGSVAVVLGLIYFAVMTDAVKAMRFP